MRVSPLPGLVRLRPHPQPQDRGEPVPRRHHHGPRPGADGGDAVRRAQRPDHESVLAEYHVPVHLDVPEIDVIWTDIPIRTRRSARTASARSASPASARRSPTRSTTPPASVSAICRSRSTSCCNEYSGSDHTRHVLSATNSPLFRGDAQVAGNDLSPENIHKQAY